MNLFQSGERTEKEREKNNNVWLPLECLVLLRGPGLQPRHVL